jgi:signal transduction histidine kinase
VELMRQLYERLGAAMKNHSDGECCAENPMGFGWDELVESTCEAWWKASYDVAQQRFAILSTSSSLELSPKVAGEEQSWLSQFEAQGVDLLMGVLSTPLEPFEQRPFTVELKKTKSQGQVVIYQCRGLCKQEQDVIFIQAFMLDITEQRREIRELKAQNDELQQFSYRVSHDLRSPISTARGFLRLASDRVEQNVTADLPVIIGRCDQSLSRLDNMLMDMMRLSKIDVLGETLESVKLKELMEEIRLHASPIIKETKAQLELQLEFQGKILLHSVRFRQILDNLISNALKYRHPKRACKIVIRTSLQNGEYFCLELLDNGRGIKKEALAKIFDLYFREENRDCEGNGLGLYIVKKHIERMKGSITVDSNEEGSCFKLLLPFLQESN